MEDYYILWLSRISSLGLKKQLMLLEQFGSGEAVFKAKKHELSSICFLSDENMSAIKSMQNDGFLDGYISDLEKHGMSYVSILNPEYPALLKEIQTPPMGLYIIGELPDDSLPKISLIGSRKCSEYGLTVTYKLSKDLAQNGAVVVSGMARGIDSMAHKGALDGGGQTIAVLGCGADICYPSENRALRERIVKSGCIISEYPPGTQPLPAHFPARNRIISGLSLATIVAEAAKKSGTLITVEQALDQGREVMAIPGNVTSKLSQGTNELIKDGAVIVSDYFDVFYALGIDNTTNNLIKTNNNIKTNTVSTLAPKEQMVYACMSYEPVDINELMEKFDMNTQTITYILTMLELKGHIKKLSGNRFIKAL